jgi:hypothetical protein
LRKKNFRDQLEKCRDYGDIFKIVKRIVKQQLDLNRAGLMLYLGNLPLHIGAYHGFGTNGIVINKRLVELISVETLTELNSYIFMLLLHEYLHSLGYLDEKQVTKLSYEISKASFGNKHPTSQFVLNPPKPKIPPSELQSNDRKAEFEIIKDFERTNLSYIN